MKLIKNSFLLLWLKEKPLLVLIKDVPLIYPFSPVSGLPHQLHGRRDPQVFLRGTGLASKHMILIFAYKGPKSMFSYQNHVQMFLLPVIAFVIRRGPKMEQHFFFSNSCNNILCSIPYSHLLMVREHQAW